MNRRAIELSINFIVLFILSMAMFATGVTLAYKIFHKAEIIKISLDDKTRQQIMDLLTEGPEKIIIPIKRKNVEPGGSDVFGIGIRNDLDAPQQFYINVECDAAYKPDKTTICDEGTATPCSSHASKCNDWLSHPDIDTENYIKLEKKINKNERAVEELFVIVPKGPNVEKGTYVFNVRVCAGEPCDENNQYSTTKKIYVEVS